MKTLLKWLLVFLVVVGIGAGVLWSYRLHHAVASASEDQPASTDQPDPSGHVVDLPVETQQIIGLTVAHPEAAELPREVVAYGQVMDPSPLVALDADLATAESALESSRATIERERGLFSQGQNVSRKIVESAEMQFRADETREKALRRRLQIEWGDSVASLTTAERGKLLDDLAQGRAAFIRADVPAGEPLSEMPVRATVTLLGREDARISTDAVSPAAAVDPKTQAQGFVLLIRDAPLALRPGAAVVARLALPGPAEKGFIVPRAAVIRQDGSGWVFVKTDAEKFERRPVPLDHPGERGWFAASGFSESDALVVTGAQSLLSEELKSQMEEE